MNSEYGELLLRFARFFAAARHGDQKYGGGLPYTHHLQQVEEVMKRFGCVTRDGQWLDYEMLAACWLHDVVEDTPTKLKEIAELFTERVADLVRAVTNEPGENRKVRHALTYPKTLACPGAVRLKLADRIANVSAGGKLVEMYRKEYDVFRRNLYTAGQDEDMWAHLDLLMQQAS